MTGRDSERDQLASALEAGGATYLAVNPGRVLDALLPVVDRIANERAAAELEELADTIPCSDSELEAKQILRARADALDPK